MIISDLIQCHESVETLFVFADMSHIPRPSSDQWPMECPGLGSVIKVWWNIPPQHSSLSSLSPKPGPAFPSEERGMSQLWPAWCHVAVSDGPHQTLKCCNPTKYPGHIYTVYVNIFRNKAPLKPWRLSYLTVPLVTQTSMTRRRRLRPLVTRRVHMRVIWDLHITATPLSLASLRWI